MRWLVDAGHGGMYNGRYTTAPQKMYRYPDGLVIYEGVINRAIAFRLCAKLTNAHLPFEQINDNEQDTPLDVRVERANEAYDKDSSAVFLSIHSNLSGQAGFEIFTSKGETKSDKIAQVFCDTYQQSFPNMKFRSDTIDGDEDKESNFYVLYRTKSPALLVENLFIDNRFEAEFLLSESGQEQIAECLLQSIKKVESTVLNPSS
jgi:N-acetylmuramoyl-L-alanine amidase